MRCINDSCFSERMFIEFNRVRTTNSCAFLQLYSRVKHFWFQSSKNLIGITQHISQSKWYWIFGQQQAYAFTANSLHFTSLQIENCRYTMERNELNLFTNFRILFPYRNNVQPFECNLIIYFCLYFHFRKTRWKKKTWSSRKIIL